MSTTNTLAIISSTISVLNGLISLSENSSKYREMVAKAIAGGENLSEEQLADLKQDALDAIAEARKD